jgi:hypothetical protein
MAFSSSIRKAQNPKLCELCKSDTNIKWKCVECNKFICNRCKDIHLNVQTNIQLFRENFFNRFKVVFVVFIWNTICTHKMITGSTEQTCHCCPMFCTRNNESITTIKKREKTLIDGITKHSQKLQNEIELERKTVKKTFCDLKRQADHFHFLKWSK